MKKNFITALAFVALPFCLLAQDVKKEKIEKEEKLEKKEKDKKDKKQTREIIIRQKGDKDIQLKVEINGDNVTVNGKPLSEFKDSDVTINKRKMMISEGGDKAMYWNFAPEYDHKGMYNEDMLNSWNVEDEGKDGAFLGVTTEDEEDGAKITQVVKGSAAEKAGLKKGDIITKVGDEKITGPEELSEVISDKKPKEELKVIFKRDGKESSVKAILGERKTTGVRSFSYSGPRAKARTFSIPRIAPNVNVEGFSQFDMPAIAGIDGMDIFPRQKKIGLKLQDTEDGDGVKVINVEDSSAAAIAGLKNGDVIVEINGTKIENTDEAREEMIPDADKKSYKIKAKRNGAEMNFDVKIPRKLKTADF